MPEGGLGGTFSPAPPCSAPEAEDPESWKGVSEQLVEENRGSKLDKSISISEAKPGSELGSPKSSKNHEDRWCDTRP